MGAFYNQHQETTWKCGGWVSQVSKVPVLSFGTGTFGDGNEFFNAWGATDVKDATRIVDICLDAGVNMFDTADVYSAGHVGRSPRQGDRGTPRPDRSSPPRRRFARAPDKTISATRATT